ncbi:SPOR domain-containing protein [Massilia sp. R2A-15]|uniref:SPOR domain-containing protein n=1 Tax=Massilia sp. R2A-15 TaxID=3064278 RepID=UPI00273636B4|nr:SPOR domain-containing protein [Massilia sp. R2A-15]WLI89699.1 SPOR domain-containing protein [Massilia sp. R2A-15]
MHLTPRRQQGNTLTGLIIGLIVGLGIAVAVALVITKGSTPFTEKSAKAGKPTDPTPGQVTDPNKPLYGSRDAAREANKQFAEKAKPAADADPLAKVIAGLKDPADLKAEGKAPVAPPAAEAPAPHELARVVAARTEAAADDKVVYFLQAGAFREMSDAEATRAKLALLGFEASISDRTSDAGVLHRVRIGPFSQVEARDRARAKLIDSGVDVAIVRNQK